MFRVFSCVLFGVHHLKNLIMLPFLSGAIPEFSLQSLHIFLLKNAYRQ